MNALQVAKQIVLDYCADFDASTQEQLADTLSRHTVSDYHWRGMHPFYGIAGQQGVCKSFWLPLRNAFAGLQRRPDIFLAGHNKLDTEEPLWVCQMGHFMGLFDRPWLDIPPTQRMVMIRFVEFHRIADDRIAETVLFIDLIGVMRQAGQYPLPPQTGSSFIYPGPLTHDGLLLQPHSLEQGKATLELIDRMVADLSAANQESLENGDDKVDPAVMARTWHNDMIWYGPEGIGATYTIDRYQQQHQYPFRCNLAAKTFNGHIARFAEGNYGCFFGWPNLTNTPTGGFLGMTGGCRSADMRVVDVYRRDGDKLAENWVIIDLPHWLNMQGLDVLARMRQLHGVETVN
ncbi:MAG: nuclear transport factor 2 family protein [Granulosicoccus sp.]|nr:nuclear transport factor 2 family protein [Granulosicoccus sp.]